MIAFFTSNEIVGQKVGWRHALGSLQAMSIRRVCCRTVVSILFVAAHTFNAFAQDTPPPRETTTTISCGNTVFSATTKYYMQGTLGIDIGEAIFRFSDQQIEIRNEDVKKQLWSNTATPESMLPGRLFTGISPYAFDWVCVSNGTRGFVVIRFGSGGNCADCAWFGIYDPAGRMILNTQGKTWKSTIAGARSAGLPKSWVDEYRKNAKLFFDPK